MITDHNGGGGALSSKKTNCHCITSTIIILLSVSVNGLGRM